MKKIIFIYNADSGLFNLMADMAHKSFSPETYSCDLCKITHGVFSVKKDWQKFLDSLDIEKEFYHKNDLPKIYDKYRGKLPAVILMENDREVFLLQGKDFEKLSDLRQLIARIQSAISDFDNPKK